MPFYKGPQLLLLTVSRAARVKTTISVISDSLNVCVKEKRYILHTIKGKKSNRIGQILHRNCLLIHVIEATIERGIEMTGRQGIRSKQLP
jgi:hypothetical protein